LRTHPDRDNLYALTSIPLNNAGECELGVGLAHELLLVLTKIWGGTGRVSLLIPPEMLSVLEGPLGRRLIAQSCFLLQSEMHRIRKGRSLDITL
jgi:hypothetical protein